MGVAFILLLAGVMVLLVSTASGDGTVAGKIQMFMSYSIGLTHFLLALLVTFLACRTLDQDIKTLRIDSLVTKPIARWQLLLGRWIGISILALSLMAISLAVTFGVVHFYAGKVQAKTEDEFKIRNQVLVARQGYKPPMPDVADQVAKRYEQLRAEGSLPENKPPSEIQKALAEEFINRSRTVGPKQWGTWKITGLKPPQAGDVVYTLRFKYEPSSTTNVDQANQLHGNTIMGQWVIGRKESPKVYVWQGEKPYRTIYEINVPVNAIEPDGSLTFSFVNIDPRNVSVHFPVADGMEVLVREGTFAPNFIRTGIITAMTILFVVTLALACGTFLSFPIASLLTISVFFIGLSGNFLSEAVGFNYGFALTKNILEYIEKIGVFLSLMFVPVLDVGTYTSSLIDGRVVAWREVLRLFISLMVIKGGILALFGAFIFHRRELGKVVV